ncbi:MAG: 2-C-methyl-D-erythritol 4-phosphate cytidylyltransferase [Candidatus Omnitrophica bacterium CG1_02_49_16]|nr:MAG: 2-C-methyl-D-erythritol 4-phosphate cytidylyltransferase [Candidatus Omnitrophica bacterium CG1_02_49_16]
MKVALVIPAAGRGKRLKTASPKALVRVLGRPILIHTVSALERSFHFYEMVVLAPANQVERFRNVLKRFGFGNVCVVPGGRTRAESVKNGVKSVSDICEWVLVHDAARPLVDARMIRRLIRAAKKTGAAITAALVTSTVKRVNLKRRVLVGTENRDLLVMAQTPQIFKKNLLMNRYKALGTRALLATDEAALFDGTQTQVRVVPGDEKNIKVTTPEDIELFKFYLNGRHSERA